MPWFRVFTEERDRRREGGRKGEGEMMREEGGRRKGEKAGGRERERQNRRKVGRRWEEAPGGMEREGTTEACLINTQRPILSALFMGSGQVAQPSYYSHLQCVHNLTSLSKILQSNFLRPKKNWLSKINPELTLPWKVIMTKIALSTVREHSGLRCTCPKISKACTSNDLVGLHLIFKKTISVSQYASMYFLAQEAIFYMRCWHSHWCWDFSSSEEDPAVTQPWTQALCPLFIWLAVVV